jgi:hypothetical protein
VKNNLATDATLYTFIDWNHDSDFDDTDESWTQIITAGTTAAVIQHVSTTFPWPGVLSWSDT